MKLSSVIRVALFVSGTLLMWMLLGRRVDPQSDTLGVGGHAGNRLTAGEGRFPRRPEALRDDGGPQGEDWGAVDTNRGHSRPMTGLDTDLCDTHKATIGHCLGAQACLDALGSSRKRITW